MSGIRIRCPETGTDVDTGFDAASLDVLNDVYFTLEDCPRCGSPHGWSTADALPAQELAAGGGQRIGNPIERS